MTTLCHSLNWFAFFSPCCHVFSSFIDLVLVLWWLNESNWLLLLSVFFCRLQHVDCRITMQIILNAYSMPFNREVRNILMTSWEPPRLKMVTWVLEFDVGNKCFSCSCCCLFSGWPLRNKRCLALNSTNIAIWLKAASIYFSCELCVRDHIDGFASFFLYLWSWDMLTTTKWIKIRSYNWINEWNS